MLYCYDLFVRRNIQNVEYMFVFTSLSLIYNYIVLSNLRWWVSSTGMGTCCNATGGPAVRRDALAALEDAKTSGVRVFRYFASLWGAGNKMWVHTPNVYWQQHDMLMDAIERNGLYCVPSIGTGKMWALVANAVTPGLHETINDVVMNTSSISWRLQARYFQEFTQRYAKRHAVLVWAGFFRTEMLPLYSFLYSTVQKI